MAENYEGPAGTVDCTLKEICLLMVNEQQAPAIIRMEQLTTRFKICNTVIDRNSQNSVLRSTVNDGQFLRKRIAIGIYIPLDIILSSHSSGD